MSGASAIALDASQVYWDFDDVQSAPLDGGSVTTLLNVPFSAYTRGLAVDATSLYFLLNDSGQEKLESIPIGGGPPTVLASGWSYVNGGRRPATWASTTRPCFG